MCYNSSYILRHDTAGGNTMTDRAVAPQEADRVRAEIRKVIRHYKQHSARAASAILTNTS